MTPVPTPRRRDVADASGSWYLGVAAGFISMALAGLLMQTAIFRRMAGQDLRQTLVTIGLSIVLADLMLAIWGGKTYQFCCPLCIDEFAPGLQNSGTGPKRSTMGSCFRASATWS